MSGQNDEYKIEMGSYQDRDEFLELHHSTFGTWPKPLAEQVFNWKYVENPLIDETRIVVVRQGSDIVATRGFFTLRMVVNSSSVLGLQSGDLMVHPRHRRKGLFRQMNEFVLEHYNDEEVIFFSFPSKAARRGYLEDGWEKVTNPQYVSFIKYGGEISVPPSPKNTIKKSYQAVYDLYQGAISTIKQSQQRYTIRSTNQIPAKTLETLYQQHIPDSIHAHRSAGIYEWRLAAPHQDTTIYLAVAECDGETRAAAVVDERGSTLVIREVVPFDGAADAVFEIIEHIRTDFERFDAIIVWPPISYKSEFILAGFLPKRLTPYASQTSAIVVNTSDKFSDHISRSPSGWNLQLFERDS